jgi:hypothetical protein
MSAEHRPDHQYPNPSKEDDQEMSLGTALRQMIDDLFTYQTVAEKLHRLNAGDALPALVETWKQGLTQHLEETVHQSVENVVAILDLLQNGDPTPLTFEEQQEWEKMAGWYKPFNVASICREDLRGILAEEAVAALTDSEMEMIADKMSNAYRDSGYWESLEINAQVVVNQPSATDIHPHSSTT